MTTIAVVSGGLSQPSSTRLLADRLADATKQTLGEPVGIVTIELRDLAQEITNALLTGFPGGGLAEALDAVDAADALIAVSPTFNASYSGLFKSFFDTVEPDRLAGKPVLIGATGGTERHSLVLEHALRPMFAYLRALVVPTAVYAASADWGAPGLTDRIERAGTELAGLLRGVPPKAKSDPFDDPVPFEQLLAS